MSSRIVDIFFSFYFLFFFSYCTYLPDERLFLLIDKPSVFLPGARTDGRAPFLLTAVGIFTLCKGQQTDGREDALYDGGKEGGGGGG